MIAYLLITDVNAVPWQSPELGLGRTRGGKPYPTATSPKNMKAYQAALRECMTDAYPDVFRAVEYGPLFKKKTDLHLFLYYWRGLDQYTGKVGQKVTGNRIDVTNANKATEDALQGLLFHNDVDNETVLGKMMEQSPDVDVPMVLIIATDDAHAHVHPLLVGRDFVCDLANSLLQEIQPPMPPGNVRLRVIQ